MEKQAEQPNHLEILKDLEKLEDKLCMLIDFYEELGILRQRRKHLVENLKEKERSDEPRTRSALKKQVTFHQSDYDLSGNRRLTRTGGHLEKKKSIAQIYDLLGNLRSYHEDVNKKISELKLLKTQGSSDPDFFHGSDLDTVLARLQSEKDEIDNKIIQFVIKDVVEGKDEMFSVISHLEEENKEMEDTVIKLEGRVDYLKDTIMALMLENHLLKKEQGRTSEIVRRSLVEKTVSLVFPMSLRTKRFGSDFSDELGEDFSFDPEGEDILSVEKSVTDSFGLDAEIAMWSTDERSMHEHVKRLGRDLEIMEVNQMKLNLLKRYVQRHGTKYINRNTLIDPTKSMSLWHCYDKL